MSDFEQKPTDFGYPEMDVSEYQKRLEAYIWLQAAQNNWEFEYGGKVYKMGSKKAAEAISDVDDIRYLIQNLKDRVTFEGVTPNAPMFGMVMGQAMSPQWMGEQQKFAVEEAQREEERRVGLEIATGDYERRWAEYHTKLQQLQYQQEMDKWKAKTQTQAQMWESERARQNLMAEQYNYQAQRMGLRAQTGGLQQAELAKAWESVQAERLAATTGTGDWLKKWDIQQEQNPWKMQRTLDEEIMATREEIKNLGAVAKIIRERQKDPTDPLFVNIDRPDVATTPEQWRAHQIMSNLKAAEDKLVEWTTSPDYIEGRKGAEVPVSAGEGFVQPTKPTGPATPAWLSKLEPTMGATVGKMEPTPPSGQAWGRLTPSQQQKWGGWAEWGGYKPEDILFQTQQMLPRPRTGTRWSAARQRTSV